MKAALIKIYFKGGVLVPFYLSCVISFFFFLIIANNYNFNMSAVWSDSALYEILKITFFSGLTGLCSITVFLNSYRKIAKIFWYSFLSFVLLPYSFIAFVFIVQVDWQIPPMAALYSVTFFFHVIGPIISFQSFRATVLLNPNDKEIMNEENDGYTMLNIDKNVKDPISIGCDASEPK
jgi:hypothetical protein